MSSGRLIVAGRGYAPTQSRVVDARGQVQLSLASLTTTRSCPLRRAGNSFSTVGFNRGGARFVKSQ
jgi:hypothetical protein